jgi:hypothetical protein
MVLFEYCVRQSRSLTKMAATVQLRCILVGGLKWRTHFWKGTTQGSFQQSLVEIGSLVSEKIFFINFISPFSIFRCAAVALSHQDGRHSAVALLLKAALIQVSDYRLLGASGRISTCVVVSVILCELHTFARLSEFSHVYVYTSTLHGYIIVYPEFSYVFQYTDTGHLQNKLTKNIHLGVVTRSSTKWDCLKPIRFHQLNYLPF